jgi:hypothetical protein
MSLPDRVSFAKAIEIRDTLKGIAQEGIGNDWIAPENIQLAAANAYVALVIQMEGVASFAGMSREFDEAENLHFQSNLGTIMNARTIGRMYTAVLNPISRIRLVAMMDDCRHMGLNPSLVLDEAYHFLRVEEAFILSDIASPFRWIAGGAGVLVGWHLDGVLGAVLALAGSLVAPWVIRVALQIGTRKQAESVHVAAPEKPSKDAQR